MQTVFVVFDNGVLAEIFSTEEKAREYIKEQRAEYHESYYHYEERELK